MKNAIERVLISEKELEEAVAAIGRKISEDYAGKDPIFVGVLKGCFIFMADLMRHVDIDCSMDFMAVSFLCRRQRKRAFPFQGSLSCCRGGQTPHPLRESSPFRGANKERRL